jgi:hypothetical protein
VEKCSYTYASAASSSDTNMRIIYTVQLNKIEFAVFYRFSQSHTTMSAFPPDWQVYEDQEFFSFGTAGLEGDLGLHVLLQVNDNGRSTGLFRTVITGQSLSLNIPTSELFTTVPEE